MAASSSDMAFIDDHRSQANIKLNNFTEEEGELPTQSNVAPTKRKRGRPKKDVGGETKKRRGRPPNPLPEKPLDAEPEPECQPDDVFKKKRGRPPKASKANLGKETCVPPMTHIMLRRSGGDVPTAGDLAEALSEVLLEKQMLREQVETLNEKLRCEKQKFEDLSSEHNQLISLCQEKESALQDKACKQRDGALEHWPQGLFAAKYAKVKEALTGSSTVRVDCDKSSILEETTQRDQTSVPQEALAAANQKVSCDDEAFKQREAACKEVGSQVKELSGLEENCSSQRDQILNLQQALAVANLKFQEEKEARISLEKDRKQQIMELERLMSRYVANREQQQQIMEQQIQDVNFQSNLLI